MKSTPTYPPAGTRPADHPIAKLFPMMDEAALHKLALNIKGFGLRDPLILHEGKILDGRNRWSACKEAGVEPRWEIFDPAKHGESPLAYVMAKNLERRHLTASQRAAVAAEALPLFEKEAKARQKASGKQHAANVEKPQPAKAEKPAAKEPARKNGKRSAPAEEKAPDLIPGTKMRSFSAHPPKPAVIPPKGKATEQAGAALGVSGRLVAEAKALGRQAPEKLEQVKAGKKTIPQAKKEAAMESPEVQTAIGRIQAVAGKALADAVREGLRLKSPKEILAYAGLSDDEMLRCRALIENGWEVKRAIGYKAQAIARTHRVGDLLDRAAANGGTFSLEIEGWTIEVKKK